MGGKLKNRAVVLAKIESTYGTDPTPTGAANAILAENVNFTINTETIDRNPLRSSFSPDEPIIGRVAATITMDVELKGSGTVDTPPRWAPLLVACAFSETINAATSIVYKPTSTTIGSVTIYYYMDGKLWKFTGCRGEVSFNLQVGQRAMMSFSMQGIITGPTDTANATPTFDSTRPVPVKNAGFTVGGDSAVISSFTFATGNSVNLSDDMNSSTGYGEAVITARTSQGSIDPETTPEATIPWYTDFINGVPQAIDLTVGSVAGNTININVPNAIYRDLGNADRNGIFVHNIPFTAAANSGGGDDEFVITHT